MKLRLSFSLAFAAVALAAPALAPAQQPAVQQDWSRTVVATPEGGFRMGNPEAPVKLVEYGSLTCGHCAAFAGESMTPLVANHVRSGRVSFEFRNYILNGIDVTASLLARCAGPENFFPLADHLFETQQEWTGRLRALSQAEKDRITSAPPAEAFAQVAEAGGLIELAVQHGGISAERGRQCVSDPAEIGRLEAMAQSAEALGVQGTPTFFLNGAMLGVNTWSEIEPLLAG